MSSVQLAVFIGFGSVFFVCQMVSQAATARLWKREKEATGRHATFPWSIAYYVWMFSTPDWASQDPEALVLLKRQRVFAARSVAAFVLMVAAAALTSASS